MTRQDAPALIAPPDSKRLSAYLSHALPALGPVTFIERYPGGQSNPTFRIDCGYGSAVLRAKPAPASELLPSAHAIEREFAAMKALASAGFPVPQPLALCMDESVTGTAFYVMSHVEGRIFRDPKLTALSAAERRPVYDAMNATLAALHAIEPAAVGLESFGGRSHYLERQVRRWTEQYVASATEPIDAMDALIAWLPRHLPPHAPRRIVHGDFRLENLILHHSEPRVLAVIDWELATLGDPMADLAYNCLPWHMPPGEAKAIGALDPSRDGIPAEADYRAAYERRSGASAGDAWHVYLAFSFFRLAAILQGVYRRALDGRATSPAAHDAGARARRMAQYGWDIARRGGRSA
ncbi:MAG: phosphotransferase family protein [Burkholderiales bacterium]